MLLNKIRASYQFKYGEPRKSWKPNCKLSFEFASFKAMLP